MHIIEYKFSLIFKYMGIPKEEIRPEVSFIQDLEFVEFQFGYLVFYVGSYFRINIRECDYAELNTIGSTMDFVRRKISNRNRLKISRRKIRPVEILKSIPWNVLQLVNERTSQVLANLSYRPLSFNKSKL